MVPYFPQTWPAWKLRVFHRSLFYLWAFEEVKSTRERIRDEYCNHPCSDVDEAFNLAVALMGETI